jgi:hypothetical protein
MKSIIKLLALMAVALVALESCIEDGVSTSSGDQPTFSVDTLKLGTVFTGQGSTTHRFVVYNRHDKVINIGHIALRDTQQGIFRLNVDGQSGNEFDNVEVRPNDSIYVFVEATAPTNGRSGVLEVSNIVDFTTLGVTRSVVLTADGVDVTQLRGVTVDEHIHLTSEYPYQIFDSLVVAEGVTLTIEAGATLYFHDSAELIVRGSLVAEGTAEQPVELIGDRLGNVAASIPFELMSGQWGGVYFAPTSHDNELRHASIRNTSWGVAVDSVAGSVDRPSLTLVNCQLHNSAGYVLQSAHSALKLVGTELSDASSGVAYVRGGSLVMNHCTLANYYLFTAIGGPALEMSHVDAETDDGSGLPYLSADISNTVFYGLGSELSHGDLTGRDVMLRRCLLKSAGSDDDNFINCLWDADPLYYTVREDYLFDYRPQEGSPVIGAADASLTSPLAATDRYGVARGAHPSIGAYEPKQ